MIIKRHPIICTAVVAMIAGTARPTQAAPWTRGFVVSAYEYAFRYGGRPNFSRGAEVEPGVDCRHGSTIDFTSPDQTRIAIERQKWRSRREIESVIAPPGLDQVPKPGATRFTIWQRAIAYRGYKRGIETYVNPWASEDPGMPEVTSRIADGFNLDGKFGPSDFVSPDGEKGIDNALYRAWGCDAPLRGNGNAVFALRISDSMRFGLFTMVLRISGEQDPMNDSDATVEIGYSPDKIVQGARGGIALDYSYRILKSAQYTKLKATIKNGVVETEQVEHLHMPRIAWLYNQTGDTNLTKGKIGVNMDPDGSSATGLIGGYRYWPELYAEATSYASAGEQDILYHQDHVALYFALRRNADGMYNEKTNRNDGISTVYRIKMSPAFVVDPDRQMDIPIVAGGQWRKGIFEAVKANTLKSIETLTPQDAPPGSTEAAYPDLERFSKKLPSRDFFLGTLDRPHHPDGIAVDNDGNRIDDQGNCVDHTVACND